MEKFKIFTDSCSDLSTEVRKQYGIEYVHMGIVVDGVEKRADLDWVDYTPEEFYGWLKAGKSVKTTQVSVPEFLNSFRSVLQEGYDILYIACSSKLSGSINTCETLVIQQLLEEYPERRIYAIDSLNASMGEGLITIEAAKLKAAGKSLDEIVRWVEENKLCFNFFATVDTLTYLKNAGRIKGAKAFFGNIMGVKPIFISDARGNNFVIKKAKGTKNSLEELINGLKEAYIKEKGADLYVGHAMAPERAEMVKERLKAELNIEPKITVIGPIVGTSCGPGLTAVFCLGKEVTRYEGDGK